MSFYWTIYASPGGSVVKALPANAGDAGDLGSIPESRRSPGGGNGNLFQYSCLENSTEEPGRLWACKESDVTESTRTHRDIYNT